MTWQFWFDVHVTAEFIRDATVTLDDMILLVARDRIVARGLSADRIEVKRCHVHPSDHPTIDNLCVIRAVVLVRLLA